MRSEIALKFYKDITPVWKRELRKAFKDNPNQRVVLMSPYITYPDVLKAFPSSSCEVYTIFSAEYFINRSSSAKALKKIHELGCKLYCLPNLHAKILTIPGQFASVGSQNLTRRSTTKNLEISVTFQDSADVDKIWKKIKDWTANRKEITLEMIEDISEKIKGAQKSYKKGIRNESKRIDTLVGKKAEIRNREKIKKRRKQLADAIDALPRSIEEKDGRIIHEENKSTFLLFSSSRPLTKWTTDGNRRRHPLTKRNRYLCILDPEGTGKMSWGRVFRTRISFFSQKVNRADPVYINSTSCKLSYSCVWDDKRLDRGENLDIKIEPIENNFSIKLKTWLSINDLEQIDISADSDAGRKLSNFISDHFEEVSKEILSHMLKPFKYKRPYKIEGGNSVLATEFFGSHGSQFSIRLRRISENPILVFSESP